MFETLFSKADNWRGYFNNSGPVNFVEVIIIVDQKFQPSVNDGNGNSFPKDF